MPKSAREYRPLAHLFASLTGNDRRASSMPNRQEGLPDWFDPTITVDVV